jgi:regulator of sirC expression with transglutaminase-like and TPR domain
MGGAAQAGEDWAERTLRALGDSDPAERLDLAEAALALASFDAPADRLDGYRDHLGQMAAEVGAAAGAAEEPEARLAALNHVLFGLHGYAGDDETYDDLQNANLIRVIDRRKGLPVALGILMIHLARAQGWEMDGLDFPGHFLLRFDAAGERRILDPFHAGATLDAPALRALLKATSGADAELDGRHYEPVSDRDILLRLQNNIKLRLIRDRRVEEALGIVERMLMVAPDRSPLWREAGLMSAHIGQLRSAITALETYVAQAPADPARLEAEGLIRELRGRLT